MIFNTGSTAFAKIIIQMNFFSRKKDYSDADRFSEEDLANSYAKGHTEALEELIRRCKADLFGYILSIVGRHDAAEDIFQETFLKFALRPELYKDRYKFRSWIFTVARNETLDYIRKQASLREVSMSGNTDDGSGDTEGSVFLGLKEDDSLRPDGQLENANIRQEIRKALDALPYEQREIFYLRHYSGLSFKEISEMTGEKMGTLLSRMSRTATALREALEKAGMTI